MGRKARMKTQEQPTPEAEATDVGTDHPVASEQQTRGRGKRAFTPDSRSRNRSRQMAHSPPKAEARA